MIYEYMKNHTFQAHSLELNLLMKIIDNNDNNIGLLMAVHDSHKNE